MDILFTISISSHESVDHGFFIADDIANWRLRRGALVVLQ